MSDAAGRVRRVPTRSCVACRTSRAKRDLARVVRTPDGRLELDETGRLAGRGAYLCRDAACWRTALAKGSLQRALGVPLSDEMKAALAARLQAMDGADATTTTATTTTMKTTMTTRGEGGDGGKE